MVAQNPPAPILRAPKEHAWKLASSESNNEKLASFDGPREQRGTSDPASMAKPKVATANSPSMAYANALSETSSQEKEERIAKRGVGTQTKAIEKHSCGTESGLGTDAMIKHEPEN